jgi:hypothetical protein
MVKNLISLETAESAIILTGSGAVVVFAVADLTEDFGFLGVHAIALAQEPQRTLRGVVEGDRIRIASAETGPEAPCPHGLRK